MNKFRVTIESIFVNLPDGNSNKLYGFFSTLEVEACDVEDAIHEAEYQLGRNLRAKGVRARDGGIFQTRFILDEIWKVLPDEDVSLPAFVSGGMVYYRISAVSVATSLARYLLLRLLKPQLVLSLNL